jgi:hypothetical protein
MKVYKLTDKNMQTYNKFQYDLGKTYTTNGEGDLCSRGWLHAYEHPLLAVLHNPIHGEFGSEMRLFEAEASGKIKRDGQMKLGCTELTLLKEIEIPKITTEQRIRYAILCAKKVYKNGKFTTWADRWISKEDRSERAAAAAARAARATAAARAAWAAERAAAAARAAARAAEAARAAVDKKAAAAAARAAARATACVNKINLLEIAEEACI